ncbi:hypothetical protein X801_03042, partial [Opisthorchis viverrini]
IEQSHFDRNCHSYTTVTPGENAYFYISRDSCGFDLRDVPPKAFAIQPETDIGSDVTLFANDGDCTRAPRKLQKTTDRYISSSGKMHIHTTGRNTQDSVSQGFGVLAFPGDERRERHMKDAACNVHLNDKSIQVKTEVSGEQEPLLRDCVVRKSLNAADNSLRIILTRDADGDDCRLRINVAPGFRINMNVEFTNPNTYMLLFDGTTCLTEAHLLSEKHKVHTGKSAGGEINILTNAAFVIKYGEISASEPTTNHFEQEVCTNSDEEDEEAEINQESTGGSPRVNEFCVHSYTAPRGFKAELSFTSMNVFEGSGDLHNFLDITGGPYCGVESIDRLGQWPHKKVVSRGPKLCVILVTDCCHGEPWSVTGVFKSSYYSNLNGLTHRMSFVHHFCSHGQNMEYVKTLELSVIRPLMHERYLNHLGSCIILPHKKEHPCAGPK